MSQPLLVLLRHGETAWNLEHRFTTRSDVPLDRAGCEHAYAAARALADVPLAAIWSSPLGRARATAEVVAEAQDDPPPIRIDERLREIDAGPFEGLTTSEIEERGLGAAYSAWHTDEEPVFPEGAETFEAALARAAPFVLEQRGAPGVTLAVTHGSLTRLLVTSLVLGGPPARHRRLWLDNGHLVVLRWRGEQPQILAFNARTLDAASVAPAR
jgi:broad specificity phosphatase PhoE